MCVGAGGGGKISIPAPPSESHDYERRRQKMREAARASKTLLGGGISSTIKTSPMGVAGMAPNRTLLGSK